MIFSTDLSNPDESVQETNKDMRLEADSLFSSVSGV